jgi:hypothetical protein
VDAVVLAQHDLAAGRAVDVPLLTGERLDEALAVRVERGWRVDEAQLGHLVVDRPVERRMADARASYWASRIGGGSTT